MKISVLIPAFALFIANFLMPAPVAAQHFSPADSGFSGSGFMRATVSGVVMDCFVTVSGTTGMTLGSPHFDHAQSATIDSISAADSSPACHLLLDNHAGASTLDPTWISGRSNQFGGGFIYGFSLNYICTTPTFGTFEIYNSGSYYSQMDIDINSTFCDVSLMLDLDDIFIAP